MNNYISIRVVLDDLLDHPLLRDVTLERAVNYTQRFLLIVCIPPTFIEKTEVVPIKDYRGVLPCDYYKMILVRVKDDCHKHKHPVYRYSTDSFHYSPDKTEYPDLTYKLLGRCIFTSTRDIDVEIAYLAIATDVDGYPLIPDNASFIEALEAYIKVKHFTTLFDLGKITQLAFLNALLEYAWAVGQALASMIMPSVDEMQAITNSWNTLLARTNEHSRGFLTNGTMEKIKRH